MISIEFTDGISSNITPLHCHISINEKIRSVFRQFIKLERQYVFIQPIKDLKLWENQAYILCWSRAFENRIWCRGQYKIAYVSNVYKINYVRISCLIVSLSHDIRCGVMLNFKPKFFVFFLVFYTQFVSWNELNVSLLTRIFSIIQRFKVFSYAFILKKKLNLQRHTFEHASFPTTCITTSLDLYIFEVHTNHSVNSCHVTFI